MIASDIIIPLIGIGVYRNVGMGLVPILEPTQYRMASFLDLSNPQAEFRFSSHNLEVVLHTLNPAPKVLITGAGIDRGTTRDSISVWESWVTRTGQNDTLVINVSIQLNPIFGDCQI